MAETRLLKVGDIKTYHPSTPTRRNSFVETPDSKFYVGNNLGAGNFGAVHLITGTNILRKKGNLKYKNDYSSIMNDIKFHKMYYGEDSATIKFFKGETELTSDEVEQEIKNSFSSDAISFRAIKKCIPGKTLREALVEHQNNPAKTLLLYLRTAEALEKLHAHGIIHGDLKPANFIVDENFNVFPIDFDWAYAKTAPRANTIILPCRHWAPERTNHLGNNIVKPNTNQDIYSFGYVLSKAHTIPAELQSIPGLVQLFVTMISDEPEARPGLNIIIERLKQYIKWHYPQELTTVDDRKDLVTETVLVQENKTTTQEKDGLPAAALPQPLFQNKPKTPPAITATAVTAASKKNDTILPALVTPKISPVKEDEDIPSPITQPDNFKMINKYGLPTALLCTSGVGLFSNVISISSDTTTLHAFLTAFFTQLQPIICLAGFLLAVAWLTKNIHEDLQRPVTVITGHLP